MSASKRYSIFRKELRRCFSPVVLQTTAVLFLLLAFFSCMDSWFSYGSNLEKREWGSMFLMPYVTSVMLGAFLLGDDEEQKTTRFLFSLAADRMRIFREKISAHALLWVMASVAQGLTFACFPSASTFKEPFQSALPLFAPGILLCVIGYECAGICSLYLNNTTMASLGGFALTGAWLGVVALVLFPFVADRVSPTGGFVVGTLIVSAIVLGGVLRWLFLRREAR